MAAACNSRSLRSLPTSVILLIRKGCVGSVGLYNHVDVKAAEGRLEILRVPSYSPEAVAEFAMALLLTVNRHTHKAYNRTRDFNMSLHGLMGHDLNHKAAGIVGTGRIGQAMIRICNGFGMQVLAYDPYPVTGLEARYVSMEELLRRADVISLHCPLTKETEHLICEESIAQMKDGVVEEIKRCYSSYFDGREEEIDLRYHNMLYRLNKLAKYNIITSNSNVKKTKEATIIGVEHNGCLLLKHSDEMVRAYAFKEVEFVL